MENNNNDRLENNSLYQEFNEKDTSKTVLKTVLSIRKSTNNSSCHIVLRNRIMKYYFFGQGTKLGIEFIENINKNESDTYKYYYYYSGENFYSKNIVIESIDSSKVGISIKIYKDSIQLSILDFDNAKQLYKRNDKLINDKNVKFLYNFKEFLYYASTDSFSVENSKNEIYRKCNIKLFFPENNEYSSFLGGVLLKTVEEYKLKKYNINQIVKDILILGNYFIFLLEKIKAIEIFLSIKYQKMLVGIPKEEVNYTSILLEEYIDKYKTEREPDGFIFEFNNYYENIEINMPTTMTIGI
jgi:hypothetical protein